MKTRAEDTVTGSVEPQVTSTVLERGTNAVRPLDALWERAM